MEFEWDELKERVNFQKHKITLESLAVPNGENLGEFTMKQPKLNNLTIDKPGTKKIRDLALKSKKIKITINIDQKSLETLKNMAHTSGASYQKILNEILKIGLEKQNDAETRLQKIEMEIAKLKKKMAA